MLVDSIELGNYLVVQFAKRKEVIYHSELHCLMYLMEGLFSSTIHKKLINEEFRAYPMGPVLPQLWEEYRHYINYKGLLVNVPVLDTYDENIYKLDKWINGVVDKHIATASFATNGKLMFPEKKNPYNIILRKNLFSVIPNKQIEKYYSKLHYEKINEVHRKKKSVV